MSEENQGGNVGTEPKTVEAPKVAEALKTTVTSKVEEAAKATAEEVKSAGNAAPNVLEVLKTNPTARYVLIGAAAVALLAMFMGGGSEVQQKAPTTVTTGQSVTLENPNGGMSQLTMAPGLISTSDAEEDKDQNVCIAEPGNKGTVEEEQVVGLLSFVKVKVAEGNCQGKTGWTSKINLK